MLFLSFFIIDTLTLIFLLGFFLCFLYVLNFAEINNYFLADFSFVSNSAFLILSAICYFFTKTSQEIKSKIFLKKYKIYISSNFFLILKNSCLILTFIYLFKLHLLASFLYPSSSIYFISKQVEFVFYYSIILQIYIFLKDFFYFLKIKDKIKLKAIYPLKMIFSILPFFIISYNCFFILQKNITKTIVFYILKIKIPIQKYEIIVFFISCLLFLFFQYLYPAFVICKNKNQLSKNVNAEIESLPGLIYVCICIIVNNII